MSDQIANPAAPIAAVVQNQQRPDHSVVDTMAEDVAARGKRRDLKAGESHAATSPKSRPVNACARLRHVSSITPA